MVVRSLKGSVCFSFSFMYPPTVHTTAVLKTPSASLWMTSSLEIMLLLGFDCWDMSLFWSLLWSIISSHSYCVGKRFSNNVWRPKSFRFLVICEELPLNLRFLFVCMVQQGWDGRVWHCHWGSGSDLCHCSIDLEQEEEEQKEEEEMWKEGKCT